MAMRASGRTIIERKVKASLAALDEAVSMFRKAGHEHWANDIVEVREFIARNRAYYDRLAMKHDKPRPDSRQIAQAMWEDIARKGK